jgi:hypothetical protein
VTYKGRPVTGGTVMFISTDRNRCEDRFGKINDQGRYEVDPNWRREGPDGTRFQICVFLDLRKYPLESPPADTRATPRPGESGGADSRRGGRRWSGAKVVRASWGSDGSESTDRAVEPVRQHRFSDPKTSELTVRLGPEPAWVDIDLKD